MNKSHNTSLRNGNLAQVPESYMKRVLEIERQYGKYCLVPLAVPMILDDKIVDWFFDHCRAIVKKRPDVADTEYGYSLFRSVNVCLDEQYRRTDPIWSDNDYPNFVRDFPHFYQQLLDTLPLYAIPRMSFWNSTRPIAPHRDHSCLLDMPNSFRVMLHDTNPDSTLYVYEDAPDFVGKRHYVPRVPDSNSFAWNNLRVEHGSDYVPPHNKILLIINDFRPNLAKYTQVLDQSISRYHDRLLVSNRSLTEFACPSQWEQIFQAPVPTQ